MVPDKDKRLTCFHEAGHAVATYYCETQDKVHEISIIPRGMAGGYTMSLPTEDRSYETKKGMQENIVTLLGGRIAENWCWMIFLPVLPTTWSVRPRLPRRW